MNTDLTPQQVAYQLNTSTETLRQWRIKKKGPGFYLLPSGRPRYTQESLERFRKSQQPEQAA